MRYSPSESGDYLHVARCGQTPFVELVLATAPVRTVAELDVRQAAQLVARLTELMAEISEEQAAELKKWVDAG